MIPTLEALDKIAGSRVDRDNAASLIEALTMYPSAGLGLPHRLAQFLAQLYHESGALRYNEEIWGPTAAQLTYEGRANLGNTEPGDGYRFRGWGLIQNTGRANATAFRDWCWKRSLASPDFALLPEKQGDAPWSALAAIWFWDSRNLNKWADAGNIEWITKLINGGLNGYESRLRWHWRASLVLLGFGVTAAELQKFQSASGLVADGVSGPLTRAALHTALVKLSTATPVPSTPTPAPAATLASLEARIITLETLPQRIARLEAVAGLTS
jgi:putative chitinase